VSDLYSNYDEYCDCWYRVGDDDLINTQPSSTGSYPIYFDGYAPVAPAPSPTATTTPSASVPTLLGSGEAKRYMRQGLATGFRHLWRFSYATLSPCSRETQVAWRCHVKWWTDSGPGYDFKGTVRAWTEGNAFDYAYKIKRRTWGCKPRRSCTKVYRHA
jgi:hypothetical protein